MLFTAASCPRFKLQWLSDERVGRRELVRELLTEELPLCSQRQSAMMKVFKDSYWQKKK